jgi:hypothetical protein
MMVAQKAIWTVEKSAAKKEPWWELQTVKKMVEL